MIDLGVDAEEGRSRENGDGDRDRDPSATEPGKAGKEAAPRPLDRSLSHGPRNVREAQDPRQGGAVKREKDPLDGLFASVTCGGRSVRRSTAAQAAPLRGRPLVSRPRLSPGGAAIDARTLVQGEWLELEVGPGRGGFVLERLEGEPRCGLVGLEVRRSKWASIVDLRIAKRGMKARGRVFAEDAKEAMGRLGPDGVFRRAFTSRRSVVEKRHQKRLVMGDVFLAEVARLVAPGGEHRHRDRRRGARGRVRDPGEQQLVVRARGGRSGLATPGREPVRRPEPAQEPARSPTAIPVYRMLYRRTGVTASIVEADSGWCRRPRPRPSPIEPFPSGAVPQPVRSPLARRGPATEVAPATENRDVAPPAARADVELTAPRRRRRRRRSDHGCCGLRRMARLGARRRRRAARRRRGDRVRVPTEASARQESPLGSVSVREGCSVARSGSRPW